ncbi:MAG: Gfo/Idh/MocA family protein [Ignavibacteriales bacterium]
MKKIKLGIIGCGIAAWELHLPALQKLNDRFEITALCNHTEPKARELSDLLGGVPYELEYKKLLRNEDVEAVDIALPIHLNYQVTKDSLEAGKHVIVEKPIAANLAEAKRMLQFPEKYESVMMVAENFRYRKVFKRLRQIIESGRIGNVYAAAWDIYHYVSDDSKYAQTRWRRHHVYPGGFMTDGGVHNIAALRDLFGEVTELNAFTKSINPGIGYPDTMGLQFETTRGVNVTFNLFYSVDGFWENRFLIFGEKGSIVVLDNRIIIKSNNGDNIEENADDDGGYIAEFSEFYDAIVEGKNVISTFAEAYKDLQVILGALRSAEMKKRVTFD